MWLFIVEDELIELLKQTETAKNQSTKVLTDVGAQGKGIELILGNWSAYLRKWFIPIQYYFFSWQRGLNYIRPLRCEIMEPRPISSANFSRASSTPNKSYKIFPKMVEDYSITQKLGNIIFLSYPLEKQPFWGNSSGMGASRGVVTWYDMVCLYF